MTVQKKILDLTGSQYLVQKVKSAINDVDSSLSTHIADTDIHVTTADKNKWNNQTYVFRYSSTALVASSTNSNALLDNTDNLKVGDKVIDSNGVLFSVTAIDTQNSTFTIGTALIDLAQDSDVVHKSVDESIIGSKRFGVVQSFTGFPTIRLYSTTDDVNVLPSYAQQQDIRYTDKNNNIIAYFIFQHRTDANEPFRTCWRQVKFDGTAGYYSINFNNLGIFYPENNNAIDLGGSGNRWKSVYATNYYYGSNNVEFSTKFVTTDTNQTISGNKTFGNGTLIVNNSSGSNIHGEIKLNGSRPGYIVADNSSDGVFNNNNCGVSILLQDENKPLHISGYKVDSNGRVFADNTNKKPVLSLTSSLIKTATLVPENDTSNCSFRILSELNYANGNPSKTLDVRFIQYDDANASSAIYSNDDGKTSLGASSRRWSKIYGTEYYYGSNNVEFSTKFVTTDTAQTISGGKTFSSPTRIYNASASVQTDVPSLVFKNSLVERASTTLDGEQTILFTDKNDNNIGSIQAKTYTSGISDIILTSYSENDGVKTTGIMIRRTPTTSKLQGYSDNITDLGDTNRRWRRVYAMSYYYGNDNVEFSNKFVTTDTNQTIHGAKTFNNHTYIYDPDATATTPNLYLRSSKIEISSQGNTSGGQDLTYLDKNNTTYAYVKGAIQSNGSAVKIRAIAKDSSDNSVVNELQMLAYTNGNKAIFPSYSNEVDLGVSSYKWKSFNGVEPSSLSLPDLSNGIDISSYITDLTGSPNVYSAPANGYIVLRSTTANVLGIVENTTGMGSYSRGTNQVLAVNLPVVKNSSISIYAICSSLTQAKFIPCQGNV